MQMKIQMLMWINSTPRSSFKLEQTTSEFGYRVSRVKSVGSE